MKHLILLSATLLLCLIIFNSCSKNTTKTSVENEIISATINGETWVSSTDQIIQEAGTHNLVLYIQGNKNDKKIELFLQLSASDTIITKEYAIAPDGDCLAIFYHNGQIDTATSGSIVLKEYQYRTDTHKLSTNGTFNFLVIAKDKNYTIKDGYFYSSGN